MKHILKYILLFLILSSFLLSLGGCGINTSRSNIDDLAYVVALGIDLGETEPIKLSFQISTLGSSSSSDSGSSGGGSEQSSSSVVYSVEASSLDSGITLINSYINKEINLSHCKALVISEEVAERGVSSYIYTLVNRAEIRTDCNVIITRGLAKDFLNTSSSDLENTISRYYNIASDTGQDTGYTEVITIGTFYSLLQDTFRQAYAILGSVNDSKSQDNNSNNNSSNNKAGESKIEENKPHIETMGLAVFKGDVLVGELNGIETVCHLIVTNKLESYTISIPSPFNALDTIDLYITLRNDTKNTVDLVNGLPYITSNIEIKARVLSMNEKLDNLDSDKISEIEDFTNKYLEEQIYNYFYKTSKNFKSDISGMGKYIVKKFLTWDEWMDYNWLNVYKDSIFKVNVNTTVKSSYLIM